MKINTIREVWSQTSQTHWLPIEGVSMLPLLRAGDEILISHDLAGTRRGDILVFQNGEGLVAHRVVRITRQGEVSLYLTKGDNCPGFDAPLAETAILGRVDRIRRDAKEYDLTTPEWKTGNSILAGFHLATGTMAQAVRSVKQALRKKSQ